MYSPCRYLSASLSLSACFSWLFFMLDVSLMLQMLLLTMWESEGVSDHDGARWTAHWGRNQQFSTPWYFFTLSLFSTLTHSFSSFIFISLFIHPCFGFCCAAVLVFCGFYRFLQPVLLYSQLNRFSLWVAGAKMLGKLGWWFGFQLEWMSGQGN